LGTFPRDDGKGRRQTKLGCLEKIVFYFDASRLVTWPPPSVCYSLQVQRKAG